MFDSIGSIWEALIIYLILGLFLSIFGPGGKDIADEVKRARGSTLTNAIMEREAPSELKLFFFRLVLTVGFALLWPFFIYGLIKEQNSEKALRKTIEEERAEGLRFHYMGGHGEITCNDCFHTEEVTSFTHGIDSSRSGFQCQACGKLTSIRAGGNGRANQYEQSLVCECGGALSRDNVIFCPQCRSKNLSYRMLFIT